MRYVFMRFPGGKAKAVTLSYDDGCSQDIRFSDVITPLGLKCTFNLNGDDHKKGRGLTADEVVTYILDRGHEVAVHGYYHRAEGSLRPIEGIRDVLDCRLELEKKFNRIIRGMAYPDTGINVFNNRANYATIKQYLENLDIAYCRIVGGYNDSFLMPNDWHYWTPTTNHSNPDAMDYIDKFLNLDISPLSYCAARYPRLFYMWGHSYEFDNGNGWERLDALCDKLAGHEDIWYATNMEIYEYTQAYHRLVYSADGKTVFNPTLFTVWLDVDGTVYSVASGETLYL